MGDMNTNTTGHLAPTDTDEFMKLYPPEHDTGKEDFEITPTEMKQIETALKDKEFRKLLSEYVEEIRVSSL